MPTRSSAQSCEILTSQKNTFLQSEGDGWFERNVSAAAEKDEREPILQALAKLSLKPRKILEIGCSGAALLEQLREHFGAECHGIDPSSKAIAEAGKRFPQLMLRTGTADDLPYEDGFFDTVIFGFCLYLCDPADHFRIAWQADRVLKSGGALIIKDFSPPRPYRNPYVHAPGLHSFKMNWADMFLWHPAYSHLYRDYMEHAAPYRFHPDERVCIDLLLKNTDWAFPPNPQQP